MNKFISKLAIRFYNHKNLYISAPLLLGLFHLPFISFFAAPIHNIQPQAQVAEASVVKAGKQSMLVDAFLGPDSQESQGILAQNMAYVSSRGAYPASLAVIKRHEATIRATAQRYGVPEDVAIGVGLLENGGSETAKSPAGALGVFQLMPSTARSLGLAVNKKADERVDPEKNIDAGVRYLALNYYRFGDWGMATWAYHAGEGNVAKAVQIYAKAHDGINLPGVQDPIAIRNYIGEKNLTIHKLLSDDTVKQFTSKLHDDSDGYPYKVMATATLFRQSGNISTAMSTNI